MTAKYLWIVTRYGHRLHRVDPVAAWPWGGDFRRLVRTACGRELTGEIPGILTRVYGQRCLACCRRAGEDPEKRGA
jgi:hypothetical protein